ncbi:MAG: hypothetical protein ACK5O7_07250 [Holosporales bacterium]
MKDKDMKRKLLSLIASFSGFLVIGCGSTTVFVKQQTSVSYNGRDDYTLYELDVDANNAERNEDNDSLLSAITLSIAMLESMPLMSDEKIMKFGDIENIMDALGYAPGTYNGALAKIVINYYLRVLKDLKKEIEENNGHYTFSILQSNDRGAGFEIGSEVKLNNPNIDLSKNSPFRGSLLMLKPLLPVLNGSRSASGLCLKR